MKQINFSELLKAISQKAKNLPSSPDPVVFGNIVKIKTICNKEPFTNQELLGGAALNRMIVRDETIQRYLSKETILEIMRQQALLGNEYPLSSHPLFLYRDINSTTIA